MRLAILLKEEEKNPNGRLLLQPLLTHGRLLQFRIDRTSYG
jgi:hypothetical protein